MFDAHARKFERSYLEDMDNLGVRRPDVMTRVSEYVPQVRFCQRPSHGCSGCALRDLLFTRGVSSRNLRAAVQGLLTVSVSHPR